MTAKIPEGYDPNYWNSPQFHSVNRYLETPSSKRSCSSLPAGQFVYLDPNNVDRTLAFMANKDPSTGFITFRHQRKQYIAIVTINDYETLQKYDQFPKLHSIKLVFETIITYLNNCELNGSHLKSLKLIEDKFLSLRPVNEIVLDHRGQLHSCKLNQFRKEYASLIEEKITEIEEKEQNFEDVSGDGDSQSSEMAYIREYLEKKFDYSSDNPL